jgi:hypothetical protein
MTNDLTAKRGFVEKVAVWLLLTLGAVLLALVVMGSKPQPAQAGGGCDQHEEGYWVNNGSPQPLDFVESIQLTCIKSYLPNGNPTHTWWIEVWVRETNAYGYPCTSDFQPPGASCTVRWVPKKAEGYTTATGAIYARYNHQRPPRYDWTDTLYANMSKNYPGVLWVKVVRVGKGYQQGAEDSTQDWLTCRSGPCTSR